jgi:hypothetical protein
MISKRKQTTRNSSAFLADDELQVNRLSSEHELRQALKLLDCDDPAVMETIFEEARQTVPMPEPPASLISQQQDSEGSIPDLCCAWGSHRFDDFT